MESFKLISQLDAIHARHVDAGNNEMDTVCLLITNIEGITTMSSTDYGMAMIY